jgi:hypothetical protein
MTEKKLPVVARRSLLLGAGAGVVGLGVLGAAPSAEAAPGGGASGQSGVRPFATTEPTPIGSAPVTGYAYRFRSFFDFTPETPTDTRAWGGYGTYTTAGGALWTSIDLEPGTRVRDIEWYIYNTSADTVSALGRVWSAGTGTLYTPVVDVSVPPNTRTTAVRGVATSANYGPFPLGSRLLLGVFTTDTTGKVQVNGVRVGFDTANAGIGVLPSSVRAYDTRSLSDPFGAGATRTITLPSDTVHKGATAVLVKLTVFNAAADGYLQAWATGQPQTTMSAVNFPAHVTTGNTILLAVSNNRQITVRSSAIADVTVDIMGTVG